jgi:hypothetical protein
MYEKTNSTVPFGLSKTHYRLHVLLIPGAKVR